MIFSEKFKFCPSCGNDTFLQQNPKSMRCATCDFVYYVNPAAATAAFIKNTKGELLVCKRANEPAKGTLDLPGGFVDNDETGEMALSREIAEELGGDTKKMSYLFSIPNKYLYSGLEIPTLDLFFECLLKNENSLNAADDVEVFYFLPLSDIDPNDFGLTSIRKAVKIYLSQYNITSRHNNFA